MECNVNDGHCKLCKDGLWGKNCNLLCREQCRCCDAFFGNCVPDKCSGMTVVTNAAIGKVSCRRISFCDG
jgi:hypothetical protein